MIQSGRDIQAFGLLINEDPKNIQAQGCDIRVEKVYYPVDKPFGEKITESDYQEFPLRKYYAKSGEKEDGFLVPPNTSVLFKIMEMVDLTAKFNSIQQKFRFFNAYVLPKSSLSRRGIIVHSAWWDAGYKGSGFVLVRTTDFPLFIKPGAEFAQMIFFEGTSTEEVYNGQYQNENLNEN